MGRIVIFTVFTLLYWPIILLSTPFLGVLIRFRGDYSPTPMVSFLQDEETQNPDVRPSRWVPSWSYLKMFKRVWRMEVGLFIYTWTLGMTLLDIGDERLLQRARYYHDVLS